MRRERLLSEHVLPVRDRREGDFGVRGRDGEVQHRLDLGIGEELGCRHRPAAGDAFSDALRAGTVEVGDRHDAHPARLEQGVEIRARNDPESDDAYRVRAAHSIPLSMMVRTFWSASTSTE